MPATKRILFVSHDASRTGAPILLLNLAHALTEVGGYEISFLINRPNYSILDRFGLYTCYKSYKKRNRIQRIWRKLVGYMEAGLSSNYRLDISSVKSAVAQTDIIISNTLTNGDLLPVIRQYYQGPIITYVHELVMASRYFTDPKSLQHVIALSDFFLAPCLTVKEFLIRDLNVASNKIDLLEYYIPEKNKVKTELTDKAVFTIGGVGTADWRKGTDLFIQVAYRLFQQRPDAAIVFTWMGAKEGIELQRLRYDIEKSGLASKVQILKSVEDVIPFYSSLDLFLLTSREDPYPLVVLEAAHMRIPTLCFDASGGAFEFVSRSGGGKGVAYLDIDGLCEAILYYFDHADKKKEDGVKAYHHLVQLHQDKNRIEGQLHNAIKKCRP